jgi:hypothetical protein
MNGVSRLSVTMYLLAAFIIFVLIGWYVFFPLLAAVSNGLRVHIADMGNFSDWILQQIALSLSSGLFGVSLLFAVFFTVQNLKFKPVVLAFAGYSVVGLVFTLFGVWLLREKLKSVFVPEVLSSVVVDVRDVPIYWAFLLGCFVVLALSVSIRLLQRKSLIGRVGAID